MLGIEIGLVRFLHLNIRNWEKCPVECPTAYILFAITDVFINIITNICIVCFN